MAEFSNGAPCRLSIIIPTYNRLEILKRCLRLLEEQSASRDSFEVLVVDDGSTDGTREYLESYVVASPLQARYFYQQNKKQGVARNLGAQHARGDLLMFIGDDILATPVLVEQHLAFHDRYNTNRNMAVLGYIRWAPDMKVTRFMNWVGEMGWQFGFSLIKDPMDLPFNFFYTSNISLPQQRFIDCGGFDEDFREYGWEDIELSLRLKERGLKIVYNPEALAYHFHPTSLASFCQRQMKVGYSALCFFNKHPEMERFLSMTWVPRYSIFKRSFLSLIRWISEWSDRYDFIDTSRYYQDLMSYYYFRGLKRALDNER